MLNGSLGRFGAVLSRLPEQGRVVAVEDWQVVAEGKREGSRGFKQTNK